MLASLGPDHRKKPDNLVHRNQRKERSDDARKNRKTPTNKRGHSQHQQRGGGGRRGAGKAVGSQPQQQQQQPLSGEQRLLDDQAFAEQVQLSLFEDDGASADMPAASNRGGRDGRHLLNFSSYCPPPTEERRTFAPPRREKRGTALTKVQFVQANCRFVVSPGLSASPHKHLEPDEPMDWDSVEAIELRLALDEVCPVSLLPFTVPLATKCAHCFSAVSILRVLAGSPTGRCPLCHEVVRKEDLRPALIVRSEAPKPGDHSSFQLLRKASKVSSPVLVSPEAAAEAAALQEENKELGKEPEDCAKPPRVSEHAATWTGIHSMLSPDAAFSRIRLAESSGMVAQHLEDLASLARQRREFMDDDETSYLPFLTEAEAMVGEWHAKWTAMSLSEEDARASAKSKVGRDGQDDPDLDPPQQCSDRSAQQVTERPIHLWQIEGGDFVFLHPVNVSCLVEESKSPGGEGTRGLIPQVQGKVVEVETKKLTPELRRRLLFLQHLPLMCDILLVELDLRDSLSPGTLKRFDEQLSARRRVREQRRRQDGRERRRKKQDAKRHEQEVQMRLRGDHIDLQGPKPLETLAVASETSEASEPSLPPSPALGPTDPLQDVHTSPVALPLPETAAASASAGAQLKHSFASITEKGVNHERNFPTLRDQREAWAPLTSGGSPSSPPLRSSRPAAAASPVLPAWGPGLKRGASAPGSIPHSSHGNLGTRRGPDDGFCLDGDDAEAAPPSFQGSWAGACDQFTEWPQGGAQSSPNAEASTQSSAQLAQRGKKNKGKKGTMLITNAGLRKY